MGRARTWRGEEGRGREERRKRQQREAHTSAVMHSHTRAHIRSRGGVRAHLHALCWLVRSVSCAARSTLRSPRGSNSVRRLSDATKASIEEVV